MLKNAFSRTLSHNYLLFCWNKTLLTHTFSFTHTHTHTHAHTHTHTHIQTHTRTRFEQNASLEEGLMDIEHYLSLEMVETWTQKMLRFPFGKLCHFKRGKIWKNPQNWNIKIVKTKSGSNKLWNVFNLSWACFFDRIIMRHTYPHFHLLRCLC